MTLDLLDTNVVSGLIREPHGIVAQRYRLAPGDAVTSIIVVAELKFGIRKAGAHRLAARLDIVLSELQVLPWDTPADRSPCIGAGLRAGDRQ